MEGASSPISSSSTSIAVGSTPEEELYNLAERYRQSPSPPGSPASRPPSSTAATGLPGSFISSASQLLPRGDSSGASNPFIFDSDMSNYPASMTSSIQQHVYEGGLRYHAFRDGKYAFPNDDVEQNRDDMKHTMTLMLCRGRHFYSPVEEKLNDGGKCLDLGGWLFSCAWGGRVRKEDGSCCDSANQEALQWAKATMNSLGPIVEMPSCAVEVAERCTKSQMLSRHG